jgi:hypothetical protein
LEERLAVVLPGAPAPVVAGGQPESVAATSPDEEEAAPWPEGAAVVEITRAPGDEPPASDTVRLRPAGPDAPLPSLDALVARIPQDVRETLDDLFRVKFINVQRLPASTLKE